MLIRSGVVDAVGSLDRMRARAGVSIRELHVPGCTILPGFIDAHTHVEFSALARNEWLDVRGVSPRATCDAVAESIRNRGEGAWVVAQGTFLQELPDRADLDRVAPRTPVIVRESMHRLQANSEALRLAGFLDRAPSVRSGIVVHVDPAGRPTGLVEEGFDLFPIPAPSVDTLADLLERELRESFARHGVTTVFEIPATRAGVAAYTDLANRRALPTRITLTPVVSPGLSPLLERMADWTAEQFGDREDSDLIGSGGIKIFIDGDNDQAFHSAGFSREPRHWGAVTRTVDQLREELIWANQQDVQVWVHAIGDLAQDLMLEAVSQSRDRVGDPRLRTRLEHAGNLQLDHRQLRRMVELKVIPVPTANFISTDDGSGRYAFRTLGEAGLEPPGNSDTGGAIAEAPNPWFGIAHLVERRNRAGQLVAPDERVSVAEGVRGYTTYAARAAGLERVVGSLAPGSAADFGVYATDPRAAETSELLTMETEMTFVGGRATWQRNG